MTILLSNSNASQTTMHAKLVTRLGRNVPHLKAMGDTPALLYVSQLLDTTVKMKYRLW